MKISFKTLLTTTFLVIASAMPAMAQDADMQALMDRLERMDRDIKALNLKVYRTSGSESSSITPSAGEDVSGPLGARLSVRINELESQMRQMTGQIEETSYRISQMTTRLDKLIVDIDYRLTALEGGTPTGQPQNALGQTGTEGQVKLPSGMSGQQLAPPSGQAPAQQVTGTKPGTLGTLSGSDLKNPSLANKPSPTPAPVSTTPAPAATETVQLNPEALYQSSRQMLMRGEFVNAEKNFKSFLETNKDHKLTGNVRYWLGETYYVQGNYAQAASTFLEGYQKSSRGAKAPDSLLKLGMSLTRMEKLREACATFGKLRADFPKMPAHLSKTLERERSSAKCN
ncbi:putative TPR repeat containing exported protein [Candidatus Terasakiella magnetica]|uniref:Cell division coordinator CpoB n=1 Tax=Candidatus Terasakiella magnetica TaxID=1867952 RepID=A0A1C3RHW6_9PROT|nr:tol-pal system protein YbgF [Candidatus Terasakiella magnetica]SCA56804.1 putative TPR repeat containing exported protein [Candidatus Terasakiella magnetica]